MVRGRVGGGIPGGEAGIEEGDAGHSEIGELEAEVGDDIGPECELEGECGHQDADRTGTAFGEE